MNIAGLKAFVAKNAPEILLVVSGIGVAGTVVLASKAGADSAWDIYTEEGRLKRKLTTKEKIALCWRNYILVGLTGGATVGAAGSAFFLQKRHLNAATALLMTTQTLANDYRKIAVKKLGEAKDKDIRDEVCKKAVESKPIENQVILPTGKGDNLFYETITGRYFTSDIESVRAAANDFMADILRGLTMSGSLNEWFDALGINRVRLGEDMGWNINNPLDIRITTMIATDGRPCLVLDYQTLPTDRYDQMY